MVSDLGADSLMTQCLGESSAELNVHVMFLSVGHGEDESLHGRWILPGWT